MFLRTVCCTFDKVLRYLKLNRPLICFKQLHRGGMSYPGTVSEWMSHVRVTDAGTIQVGTEKRDKAIKTTDVLSNICSRPMVQTSRPCVLEHNIIISKIRNWDNTESTRSCAELLKILKIGRRTIMH
jgi:hypothetical protein